jgi:hypothetical protein
MNMSSTLRQMRENNAPRILTGADSAAGAEKLRQQMAARNDWPYPHLLPPRDAIQVNAIGTAQVPTAGAGNAVSLTGQNMPYQVPEGFEFEMWEVLIDFEGVFIPGDSTFTLQVNQPGFNESQTTYVKGLVNVPVPLGSWRYGVKWRLCQRERFAPLDILSWWGTNVNLSPGPPNAYVGGVFGFLLPAIGRV